MQVKDHVAFVKSWMEAHIRNTQSLGKPFIVEEFGKGLDKRDAETITNVRDPVFKAVYDMLDSSLKSDGIFKGKPCSKLGEHVRLYVLTSEVAAFCITAPLWLYIATAGW